MIIIQRMSETKFGKTLMELLFYHLYPDNGAGVPLVRTDTYILQT